MQKQQQHIMVALIAFTAACQPISSSELKTTKAEDLKLTATVRQYNDTEQVEVAAQMKTLQSGVGIELNQGETLTAAVKAGGVFSASVNLSNGALFNLANSYDGTTSKVGPDGAYVINYKDSDDVTTTASVQPNTVPDLIAPENSATLSGDTATVTWDAAQADGPLEIVVNWKGNGAVGYSSRTAENTGSYELDLSNYYGTGTLDLVNTMTTTEPQGFGAADIRMKCISRRHVSFSQTASGAAKSVMTNAEDVVDGLLHACIAHCGDDEESWFEVGGERYSCCLRDYL